jgi:hypothetical protein
MTPQVSDNRVLVVVGDGELMQRFHEGSGSSFGPDYSRGMGVEREKAFFKTAMGMSGLAHCNANVCAEV